MVYTRLCANRLGSAFIVARQHNDFDTHILQFPDSLRRILLDHISYCDHAEQSVVFRKQQRGFSLGSSLVGCFFHFLRQRAYRTDILQTAALQYMAVQFCLQTVSGQCGEFRHFIGFDIHFFCFFNDRPGKRVFRLCFQRICFFQQFSFFNTGSRYNIRHLRFTACDRACFIQCYDLYFTGRFK